MRKTSNNNYIVKWTCIKMKNRKLPTREYIYVYTQLYISGILRRLPKQLEPILWIIMRRPKESSHSILSLIINISGDREAIIFQQAVQFPFRHRFVVFLLVPGIVQWHLEITTLVALIFPTHPCNLPISLSLSNISRFFIHMNLYWRTITEEEWSMF